MAELRHGNITVQIPDSIAIPARAGTMSPEEVRAIPKTREGLGQACTDTAQSWQDAPTFKVPDVDPAELRRKGQMAEDMDGIVASAEVLLNKLKQANLLLDADAWESIRKVNDQVKAQGKHNPELLRIFKRLSDYMTTRGSGPSAPSGTPASGSGTPFV